LRAIVPSDFVQGGSHQLLNLVILYMEGQGKKIRSQHNSLPLARFASMNVNAFQWLIFRFAFEADRCKICA
jgi:hypothetical protein